MNRLNIQWFPRWSQPTIATVTLLVLTLSASAVKANTDAASKKTITLDADTVWVVSADEPEPLRRALRDVETDWYKVLGRLPTVLDRPPENWDRPVIYFGVRAPWLKDLHQAEYSGPESFVLRTITDNHGMSMVGVKIASSLTSTGSWHRWLLKQTATPSPSNRRSIWPGSISKSVKTPTAIWSLCPKGP
jgi:hypothetical protein